MKYVPVLRYRQEERNALFSLPFTSKTFPLLEIMSGLPPRKQKGTFKETFNADFSRISIPFMVDIPVYFKVNNSTLDAIRGFLPPLVANETMKLQHYVDLKSNANLVPVVSYNYRDPYVAGSYVSQAHFLRNHFPRIAFRVFECNAFASVLNDVSRAVQPGDVILHDIDHATVSHPVLTAKYNNVVSVAQANSCSSVLIRSAINPDIVYNKLIDGAPVLQADNSLRTLYQTYGFDGFGDCAGVRKDASLTKGSSGEPSPGFLYYSYHNNYYVGYKGRVADMSEFSAHIAPSVVASSEYNSFGGHHHDNCPGCLALRDDPKNDYASWKRTALQHYMYSMEELL